MYIYGPPQRKRETKSLNLGPSMAAANSDGDYVFHSSTTRKKTHSQRKREREIENTIRQRTDWFGRVGHNQRVWWRYTVFRRTQRRGVTSVFASPRRSWWRRSVWYQLTGNTVCGRTVTLWFMQNMSTYGIVCPRVCRVRLSGGSVRVELKCDARSRSSR